MPIYFDEDCNYATNKEQYLSELVKVRSYKSFGVDKPEKCCEANRFGVKNRDIAKALKLYE